VAISTKLTEVKSKSKPVGKPLSDVFGGILLITLAIISLLALVLPMIVIVIVSFDSGPILRFPPQDLSIERYTAVVNNSDLLKATSLSAYTAIITVIIDILLGVPAAIGLVRGNFPGKSMIIGFLQSPIMIPGIVIGISILFFVSYAGFNVSVPLMILSHVVITMPYVIRVTTARMESADKALEDAAENLGANKLQIFRYILLPHLLPGIVGGSAFAFLLSFDQLPVSIFTAPIIEPPLPVFLFRLLLYSIDPMVAAIATIQIIITLSIFAIASRSRTTDVVIH
jgi:putative spermidine/putrescine transport system permease protein